MFGYGYRVRRMPRREKFEKEWASAKFSMRTRSGVSGPVRYVSNLGEETLKENCIVVRRASLAGPVSWIGPRPEKSESAMQIRCQLANGMSFLAETAIQA